MSRLSQDLAGVIESPQPGSHDCKLCFWIPRLDSDDREWVARAVHEISAAKLAEIMTRNGYPVSRGSTLRHRRHTERPTTS
jgi:hypothetical protein